MTRSEDRLLAQKAQIEAKLDALRKRQRDAERRDAEKRERLAGRVLLAHAANDHAFATELRRILDQALTKPKERALFDLPSPTPSDSHMA